MDSIQFVPDEVLVLNCLFSCKIEKPKKASVASDFMSAGRFISPTRPKYFADESKDFADASSDFTAAMVTLPTQLVTLTISVRNKTITSRDASSAHTFTGMSSCVASD